MFKYNKESGQMARLLLVIAAVVLVAIVIAFLIMKMAEKPPKPPVVDDGPKVELPVYEQKLGNIRFVFMSARDMGKILKASDVSSAYYNAKDLSTSEKFIMVTVGAQNKGTVNIEPSSWDLGDIVDSDNRRFVPLDEYTVGGWLPEKKLCKTLLKPEFDPTPCVKIYEVSKGSTKLKIEVLTGENNNSERDFNQDRRISGLIDLIVK